MVRSRTKSPKFDEDQNEVGGTLLKQLTRRINSIRRVSPSRSPSLSRSNSNKSIKEGSLLQRTKTGTYPKRIVHLFGWKPIEEEGLNDPVLLNVEYALRNYFGADNFKLANLPYKLGPSINTERS